MNVTILDDYGGAVRSLDCMKMLEGHSVAIQRDAIRDLDRLSATLASTDALVLIRERTTVSESLLVRLPRLKLICQTGGSINCIDVGACTKLGIAVACALAGTPDYSWAASHASAEFTWALILAATRRVAHEASALRAGRWQTTIGTTTRNCTLGVLGYGRIGAQVARIGTVFGMHPLAWGREGSRTRAGADGVEVAQSKQDLFARSDVLTLHLTLTDATRGFVTKGDLAAMKPTALFVNTSRAALLAPGCLVEALEAGRPGYAAVDVFETEPLAGATHPLLEMENVLCTPHIAFVERDSYEQSFARCFAQINAFVHGAPIDIVNLDALQASGPRAGAH